MHATDRKEQQAVTGVQGNKTAEKKAQNTKRDVIVVRLAFGPSCSRPGVEVAVKVEEAEEVLVVVHRDCTKLFGGGDGGGEMCWR